MTTTGVGRIAIASAFAAVLALAVGGMIVVIAGPANAASQVTRGSFSAFAAAVTNPALAAEYGDLAGRAQMVRTADGRTLVTVHVTGLKADTAYGSHVHKAACGVGDANGHYKHDPSGPVDAVNEIWPAFTSNADGIGSGKATNDFTAGPTAVSVVVHAPGGAKIGCADLS